jgi:RNA recognition motif-containing protein
MQNEYKIFVGNIPFNSSNNELINCFYTFKDFITADIIKGRGFGFVVFSSESERDKVININNFYIKNRKLRLNPYDQIDKSANKSLLIRIENIHTDITRDDIYNEISVFCPVKKCFINTNRLTGEKFSTGILEISDLDIYNKLINLESLLMPNNTYISLKSYNNNSNNSNNSNKINKSDMSLAHI